MFFTPCDTPIVRIDPLGHSTTTIQDAIAHVKSADSVIKANSNVYLETIVFSNNMPLTLQGGYDCIIGGIVGYSEVDGQLSLQGTAPVSIGNIVIGP